MDKLGLEALMSKIKPIWRIVLGSLILLVFVYSSNAMSFGGSPFAFAFWGAAFVTFLIFAIRIKYDDPLRSMRDLMARQAAEEAARREEAQRLAAEEAAKARAAKDAERAAWEQAHGRIVTPVAGVTFQNEDGSSRQAILKDLKVRGGSAELNLEEYDYKGAPAIRVTVDGEQIGNVPRGRVAEIAAVLDRLESASLEVEIFCPEEEEDEDENILRRGDPIYRADLYLVYKK